MMLISVKTDDVRSGRKTKVTAGTGVNAVIKQLLDCDIHNN